MSAKHFLWHSLQSPRPRLDRLAQNLQSASQGILTIGQATGRMAEGILQSEAKGHEADGQERSANAQAENAAKEAMNQYLNSIKSMTEALLQSYRDIRDTQDQVKANIARNA